MDVFRNSYSSLFCFSCFILRMVNLAGKKMINKIRCFFGFHEPPKLVLISHTFGRFNRKFTNCINCNCRFLYEGKQ